MAKKVSNHHIVPRSRGGGLGDIVVLPSGFHKSFHSVFGNLYDEELVRFIRLLNKKMKSQSSISGRELEDLRHFVKRGR